MSLPYPCMVCEMNFSRTITFLLQLQEEEGTNVSGKGFNSPLASPAKQQWLNWVGFHQNTWVLAQYELDTL